MALGKLALASAFAMVLMVDAAAQESRVFASPEEEDSFFAYRACNVHAYKTLAALPYIREKNVPALKVGEAATLLCYSEGARWARLALGSGSTATRKDIDALLATVRAEASMDAAASAAGQRATDSWVPKRGANSH